MTSIFLLTSMPHMQMAKVLRGWTPRKESHCRLNETIPQSRKPIDLKQPHSILGIEGRLTGYDSGVVRSALPCFCWGGRGKVRKGQ